MAKSVWDATLDVDNKLDRNGYDLTHSYNFSTGFGRLVPVFCARCAPKSSFRINPAFGLQFMPMKFPVQTDMQARISFFKYPLRALYKDYKDLVGGFRQGLEQPYIDFKDSFEKMVGVGKIADYLNVPVIKVGGYGFGVVVSSSSKFSFYSLFSSNTLRLMTSLPSSTELSDVIHATIVPLPDSLKDAAATSSVNVSFLNPSPLSYFSSVNGDKIDSGNPFYTKIVTSQLYLSFLDSSNSVLSSVDVSDQWAPVRFKDASGLPGFKPGSTYSAENIVYSPVSLQIPKGAVSLAFGVRYAFDKNFPDTLTSGQWADGFIQWLSFSPNSGFSFYLAIQDAEPSSDVEEITRQTSPYYDSSSSNSLKQLKLSAYPFRAYEGIYNAYYRDIRNNPFVLNGQEEYNVFIPNDKGGADLVTYPLRYANWEKDMFTTAVQSPQQGRAPLVGLTTYTETSVNEDGVSSTSLKVALVDEDGRRYHVTASGDADAMKSIDYKELPSTVVLNPLNSRSLIDAATSGISIPDLRIVNAYQKYLELNMRKGYSYKQIIEGRFDCNVRYDELLMPEFIGGMTRPVSMNRIVQTTETNGDGSYAGALGSMAGDAYVSGTTDNSISVFCDEESIVMGIMTVVPRSVYTQVLPKHFLYRDLLDSFQPEFNYLGFQPITKAEICPVQAYNAGESLSDVFGYQRPWYEYVSMLDTAHGQFLTTMRNFLVNRVFNETPALNESFLLVDENQVNQVFSVTEATDKIFGQVVFNIDARLPIARAAIPRLD